MEASGGPINMTGFTSESLFAYRPLDEASQEIRLLNIQPGQSDDEVILEIFHTPLVPVEPPQDERLPINVINSEIAYPWKAYQTMEKRYIFRNSEEAITQWSHPDPKFDQASYDSATVLDPFPDFEPKYEALSYTWGDEIASTRVVMAYSDSDPCIKSRLNYFLRPNLHGALKQLRMSDRIRTVWVDALCIDQNNWSERSREVKRMKHIYNFAYRVLIWLGPAERNGSSQQALRCLEILGEEVEVSTGYDLLASPLPHMTLGTPSPASQDLQTISTGTVKTYRPSVNTNEIRHAIRLSLRNGLVDSPFPFSPSDYLAIKNLLQCPWFDRLWVFQEAHFASSKSLVMYGPHSVLWMHFRRAITVLLRYINAQESRDAQLRDLLVRRYDFASNISHTYFVSLLERTQTAKYSVVHDRIFALLGLASRGVVAEMSGKINYSLPVYRIFQEVCLAQLRYSSRRDFLVHCNIDDGKDMPEKPTWVPNWSWSTKLDSFEPSYPAGRQAPPWIGGKSEASLPMKGIVGGTVKCVSASPHEVGDLTPTILQWENLARTLQQSETDVTWKEELVDILRCGWISERWHMARGSSLADFMVDYDDGKYSTLVHSAVYNRALFISDCGHAGLGPAGARPGDIIAVILGVDLPIILRSSDAGAYQVVGCAYFSHLEHSRALHGPLPPDYRAEIIIDQTGLARIYRNTITQEWTYDDPRMGDLPNGWEKVHHHSEIEERYFMNVETGEVTWNDPRESAEELLKKGLDVRDFTLV